MTRKQKEYKMKRMAKRINRFIDWMNYYQSTDVLKNLTAMIKVAMMKADLSLLASQPTEELKS